MDMAHVEAIRYLFTKLRRDPSQDYLRLHLPVQGWLFLYHSNPQYPECRLVLLAKTFNLLLLAENIPTSLSPIQKVGGSGFERCTNLVEMSLWDWSLL